MPGGARRTDTSNAITVQQKLLQDVSITGVETVWHLAQFADAAFAAQDKKWCVDLTNQLYAHHEGIILVSY